MPAPGTSHILFKLRVTVLYKAQSVWVTTSLPMEPSAWRRSSWGRISPALRTAQSAVIALLTPVNSVMMEHYFQQEFHPKMYA
jgi:hypothetical protein